MAAEVHDSPAERARCCELAALEFDAEGDAIHAKECREREAMVLGARRSAAGVTSGDQP